MKREKSGKGLSEDDHTPIYDEGKARGDAIRLSNYKIAGWKKIQ